MRHILLILTIFYTHAICAQQLEFTRSRSYIQGEMLHLEMEITLEAGLVGANELLLITPRVLHNGAFAEFGDVAIGRRGTLISYQREVRGRWRTGDEPKDWVRPKRRVEQVYIYRDSIPYEPWMSGGKIAAQSRYSGCSGDSYWVINGLVAEIPKPTQTPQPQPQVAATPKEKVETKSTIITYKSSVYFAFDSKQIDLSLGDNRTVLLSLGELINAGLVEQITVVGYSSPVGSVAINMLLSKKRAQSVEHYVSTSCTAKPPHIVTLWEGEDYKGLHAGLSNKMMQRVDIYVTLRLELENKKNL